MLFRTTSPCFSTTFCGFWLKKADEQEGFMSNPFSYGNPVPPNQFIDRRRELRRVVGRLVNQGQSTAIVGEPRSGKTSLLECLAAPEARQLYSACEKRLVFSYLDAQTLGGEFSQAQFWEHVLRPLQERAIASDPGSPLAQAYQVCQENDFGCFVLERFLARMELTVWRWVLMLDEFDMLLHHPILNNAEFFGSLRSLASRSRGALALVIASRRPLESLNKDTQQFSRTSSPYFNFLDEITLGPWPDKDVAELLRRAGDRFTTDDRRFIAEVAGGHPYLLQVAAYELWEAYEEGEREPNRRRQQAGQKLYDEAARILGNTWRLWSPAMRQALTVVALAHIPVKSRLYMERLVRDMPDLELELRALAKRGFVAEDDTIPGGWRVRPQAFLWWLADELVRTVRDELSFEEWLRKQEWEGLLTRGEKQELDKGIRTVVGLFKGGVTTLIEAAAKGAGEAIAKGG
jgi:hypothetical protein